MSQWVEIEGSTLELTAYDTFEAMTTAFNAGQFWSSASLAVALRKWIEADPLRTKPFWRSRLATIAEIERTSKRHLEKATASQ